LTRWATLIGGAATDDKDTILGQGSDLGKSEESGGHVATARTWHRSDVVETPVAGVAMRFRGLGEEGEGGDEGEETGVGRRHVFWVGFVTLKLAKSL